MDHNHATEEIRPQGECPACDADRERHDHLTVAQRAAYAVEELIAQHAPPYSMEEKKKFGQLWQAGHSTVERLIAVHGRNKRIFHKVKLGELTVAEASRDAGFVEYRNTKGTGTTPGTVFGKGDRFWDAIGPIQRYLAGWEGRDFKFSHLPPKEAGRRAVAIEKMQRQLEGAKADLEVRSDSTALHVKGH